MTKKDYVSSASLLKTMRVQNYDLQTLDAITVGLAVIYENDNPRFDRDRFFEASGFKKAV